MITTTIRLGATDAYDRLDAHFFTSPGVAASAQVAALSAAGVEVVRVGDVANVWDPPRFARAYAAPDEDGVPYLRPYDVFDFLPAPADRLSRQRNPGVEDLVPRDGTILQTCSGRNLGPVTVADQTLGQFALSHDLIRIEIDDAETRAYVLAFLKTRMGQALLRRGKSGSVVDHITVNDVKAVPLPVVSDDVRATTSALVLQSVAHASQARIRLSELTQRWDVTLPMPTYSRPRREGWTWRPDGSVDRLDAGYFEPLVVAVREQMRGADTVRLGDIAGATLPVRYKRYYVGPEHGRAIMSGRQLLQLDPVNLRHVSDRSFRNPEDYELREGMTVFGAVGRSEGRQGAASLVTSDRAGWLASNDVMRLEPRSGVRPGELWLAVYVRQTRLQINALSFGSVVDHMNPWDVEDLRVPVIDDGAAGEAEDAWARFAAAARDMRRAIAILEDHLDALIATG
ncbi:restriction endonuclease subunit S domain-containing protein [Jiangella alkaliphila]|uniref:Type I restriction enzyme, S subunit n=1 Tax=Jiangella alkaliphila TaxID=419479 RepID=A0A1H2GBC5_9ACTN|nr:hypothetical protein [Jiangella alkaliphila]SDU16801.1 hypothetical protein SAMN04488563_0399 [Jiangella alkaliphila]